MKITRKQLRRVIRETMLNEALPPHLQKHFRKDGSSVHQPIIKDVTPAGYGPDDEDSKKDIYLQAGLTPTEESITDSYLLDDDGMWLETTAFEKLYNYFMDLGMIPYGVATGDTGEPDLWILDYLKGL